MQLYLAGVSITCEAHELAMLLRHECVVTFLKEAMEQPDERMALSLITAEAEARRERQVDNDSDPIRCAHCGLPT